MENKVLTDVDLSKLVGTKGLVVFFYPKAGTTGCSLEAQQYNRRLKEFQDLGYNVVGVSVDSTDANKTFSNDCKLDFPLISDTEKKLVDQYKVWGEKTRFGMQGWGVVRSTFVLDPALKIIWEGRDVNPTEHVDEVLQILKK